MSMLMKYVGTGGTSTHSFCRDSSNTSMLCSTRLLAVRSSLPTVTRTGFFWNVLANRRTASGHVALTGFHGHLKAKLERAQQERTHHCLSLRSRFGLRNNCPDIIFKPLIQHSIRFVQHQIIYSASRPKVKEVST